MSRFSVAERGDQSAPTVLSSHPARTGPAAPPAPDLRRAYSFNEAARLLGINESTIYKAINVEQLVAAWSPEIPSRNLLAEREFGDKPDWRKTL
jgi:hypothetical protein